MSPYATLLRSGASSDGSCVYLTFSFEDGSEERLCLLSDKYGELALGRKFFSKEEYDEILYFSQYSRAVLFGYRSLACSPSTKKGMLIKIVMKGFSPEIADEAVKFLAENKYIDERKQIVSDTGACLSKKYGPLKIKQKLLSKGYPSRMVDKMMLSLEKRDFTKPCRELAINKGIGNPYDVKHRASMYSYLSRCGYTGECIKAVLSVIYADI